MEQEVINLKTQVRRGIMKLANLLKNHHEKSFTSAEYSELYATIITICTQRPSDHSSRQVYDYYKRFFEYYIKDNVVPTICKKHGEEMVREFVKAWTIHGVMVHWMSRLFDYLEKHFIPAMMLPSLKDVGYKFFYDLVYTKVNVNIKDTLLSLIHQEREGKHIDRALVNDTLRIFVEVGIQYKDEVFIDTGMDTMGAYRAYFEEYFLQETEIYYANKATDWMDKYSCSGYLCKANDCLKREEIRATHYLHSSTLKKVMEIVCRDFIYMHKTKLLEMAYSSWNSLQNDKKIGELQVIFEFFHKNSIELQQMANIFGENVKKKRESFFEQAHDALMANKINGSKTGDSVQEQFVQQVIDLYEEHRHYIEQYFMDHSLFHASLKKAFGALCNKDVGGMKFGEHLVLYCHHYLKKKQSKNKVEDDFLEGIPKKVMDVFACLGDKDVLGDLYEKKLAQRLLFKKNVILDHERVFIAKLKERCGRSLTSKMEGMIKDITLVQDFQREFGEHVSKNKKFMYDINFKVAILNGGRWPSYKSCNIALPKEMAEYVEAFKELYATKTKNRKLTWIDALKSCTVRAYYDARAIDLVVGVHQAALLLLFNDADKLSYKDIKSQLNTSDKEVVELVHSLSCGKYEILNKYPKNNLVAKSDIFEFNNAFIVDKVRRIKIPLRSVEKKKIGSDKIIVDRRYAIDACIVRIMKMRKKMRYQELEKECYVQCKMMSNVDRGMIKRQVESLIDREFLERDSGNHDMFHYVA